MSLTTSREICLPKTMGALGEVRAFTEQMVGGSTFDAHARRLIVLAIDEAITCFVGYAESRGRTEGAIVLRLSLDDVCLSASITDSDTDCHPGDLSPVEMMEAYSGEHRHRLAVFLIRAIMDEVSYVYRRGLENQFQMTKFTPVSR